MRRAPLLLLFFTAMACSRAPSSAADAPVALASAPSSAPAPAPDPPARPSFVDVAALPSGPIVVKGYPHTIRNGMNDPASHVGFTREGSKDGSLFGYCAEMAARDPAFTHCELVDRKGDPMELTSDTRGDFDPKKKREIDDFLRDNQIPEIKATDIMTATPEPLRGRWAFTDITLEVLRVAPTLDASGAPSAPAVVRVGGSVSGEAPVYPITLSKSPASGARPHFAVMNGMAISPDGTEIGMVAHFFACEWCDFFAIERVPLSSLASRIYNDTGFRFHQKGAFDRSAALFAKATVADPSAPLPPYNLACAWARLGDPRAKDALTYAIERDGRAKARARIDPDFDAVRGERWFVEAAR
ncbi:MAG: hypothetical protein KF819_00870 [Labilithrix sp.]|nr:hypothetical protein [Labilithrix sp.]